MSALAIPGPNPLVPGPRWTSHRFIPCEVMDDQLKHQLGMMAFGMSDLGECLEAARTIAADDEESWVSAWGDRARVLQQRAESAGKHGRRVSAADAYLRAATYWRASLMHFSRPDDPRTRAHAISAYDCYDRYLALSGYPGEPVRIPYEDGFLPSYLYRSPAAGRKAPLLIFFQGRDAWPEDSRWLYDGAIRRGYHCLSVQGPGQGLALRLQGLPFRHDWEQVVTPVVDVAVALEGVDADRIGLMGLSFGGYLAPRAAAFEQRLKVCVADPGVLHWGESIRSGLPASLGDALAEGPEAFNAAAAAVTAGSPLAEWFLRDAAWKHGVSTPYDLFQEFDACDLTGVAGRISCETLVMDGAEERFSAGQARQLYDALDCPKEFLLFDGASTAQLHCQNGGTATAAESTFDWLDGRL
ncbi:alpha/beta hydrolase family protein [Streptomyces yaizuensis]|uniref:Esterase FrsA n=1 Tax=Streptomyces yaizuensis TaxID=2989713 RepID=A0ABQ5P7F1_9ACTN|nr:alpha/beta hydrolase [Streptomyces sp. YSPA8]GLF98514.1 esterase FrsA [Streptomyces sp. YSPA8]